MGPLPVVSRRNLSAGRAASRREHSAPWSGRASPVVTDVADEVRADLSGGESPRVAAQLKAVSVAAAGDGLKREAVGLLEDSEVRARRCCSRGLIDVNHEIRRNVTGSRRAVAIGLQRRAGKFLHRCRSMDACRAERELGVVEQCSEASEIAIIDEEGIAGNKVLDATVGGGQRCSAQIEREEKRRKGKERKGKGRW